MSKIDKNLLNPFIQNNPHCVLNEDDSGLLVEKPWGRDDARLRIDAKDTGFAEALNKTRLNPRFDGITHLDSNELEFVYAYLRKDDEHSKSYMNREFQFHFEGYQFNCKFAEPSSRLMEIAARYERVPTEPDEPSIPQLRAFRDAQRLDKLSPTLKEYFDGRVPRNFFVSSNTDIELIDLEKLVRHINFIIHYYDRESPLISIKEAPSNETLTKLKKIRLIEDEFPENLVVSKPIDDIIIRLMEVARKSQPRFAFIYYYQVFEYAGYYYIDEKARSSLKNALRDPSLICGGEEKISELFSIFTDLNNTDEVRMRKVIEDHCDPRVIWKEILNDREFFSTDQHFDGGFIAKAIIAKDLSEDGWTSMWMPKTFDQLTKIRNVLVHAREKRESKVILPSTKNNSVLNRYIPLISRISEQLALKA